MGTLRQEVKRLAAELKAMTAERDEWERRARGAQEAQIARGDVFSDTNPEAQYVKDCENACPACGGSGHKDDAASYVAERDALVDQAKAEGRKEGMLEAAGIALAETKVPPQYNVKDKWRADIGADIWTAILDAAEKEPRHD